MDPAPPSPLACISRKHGNFKRPAVEGKAYTGGVDLHDLRSIDNGALAENLAVDHRPPLQRFFMPDDPRQFQRRRSCCRFLRNGFGRFLGKPGSDALFFRDSHLAWSFFSRGGCRFLAFPLGLNPRGHPADLFSSFTGRCPGRGSGSGCSYLPARRRRIHGTGRGWFR